LGIDYFLIWKVAAQFELYNMKTGILADPDWHDESDTFDVIEYEADGHDAEHCPDCLSEHGHCNKLGNAKKGEIHVPFERRAGAGDANVCELNFPEVCCDCITIFEDRHENAKTGAIEEKLEIYLVFNTVSKVALDNHDVHFHKVLCLNPNDMIVEEVKLKHHKHAGEEVHGGDTTTHRTTQRTTRRTNRTHRTHEQMMAKRHDAEGPVYVAAIPNHGVFLLHDGSLYSCDRHVDEDGHDEHSGEDEDEDEDDEAHEYMIPPFHFRYTCTCIHVPAYMYLHTCTCIHVPAYMYLYTI